jgi:hypothetical protein
MFKTGVRFKSLADLLHAAALHGDGRQGLDDAAPSLLNSTVLRSVGYVGGLFPIPHCGEGPVAGCCRSGLQSYCIRYSCTSCICFCCAAVHKPSLMVLPQLKTVPNVVFVHCVLHAACTVTTAKIET